MQKQQFHLNIMSTNRDLCCFYGVVLLFELRKCIKKIWRSENAVVDKVTFSFTLDRTANQEWNLESLPLCH